MNGRWERYAEGILIEKGGYIEGKKDGLWVFYAQNGYKQREQEFKDGKPNGKWIEYFSVNKKSAEGEYNKGQKSGTWRNYDKKGNVLSETIFKNGKKIKEEIKKKQFDEGFF